MTANRRDAARTWVRTAFSVLVDTARRLDLDATRTVLSVGIPATPPTHEHLPHLPDAEGTHLLELLAEEVCGQPAETGLPLTTSCNPSLPAWRVTGRTGYSTGLGQVWCDTPEPGRDHPGRYRHKANVWLPPLGLWLDRATVEMTDRDARGVFDVYRTLTMTDGHDACTALHLALRL